MRLARLQGHPEAAKLEHGLASEAEVEVPAQLSEAVLAEAGRGALSN